MRFKNTPWQPVGLDEEVRVFGVMVEVAGETSFLERLGT